MINEIEKTLQILFSETTNLRILANMSGVHSKDLFYGADFRGVDLSNQDLKGLLFLGTDFRSANLDNISFDEGSLNGALVDERYASYKDIFNISPDEFCYLFETLKMYSLRVGARTGFLDSLAAISKITYADLARCASMTVNPLRRFRYGSTVSLTTVKSILDVVDDIHQGIHNNLLFSPLTDSDIENDRLKLSTPCLTFINGWGEETYERSFVFNLQKSWAAAVAESYAANTAPH